jgi:hypothetical protein
MCSLETLPFIAVYLANDKYTLLDILACKDEKKPLKLVFRELEFLRYKLHLCWSEIKYDVSEHP